MPTMQGKGGQAVPDITSPDLFKEPRPFRPATPPPVRETWRRRPDDEPFTPDQLDRAGYGRKRGRRRKA